ncbi:hypothetical protein ASF84_18505 [Pseudomonas sp. Leaf127]|uniref:hypothetical protein n=1 Tax=Pseudomonas sp. Leaf127 TaxID=1736267 RepID=UPI0007035E76|nr:hypothetical protein [Pseudomonas sp. Leaf127]KQQ53798.1 hypothetical protein ASF84_18505 [Pseudomonas sp. Leaf127]
MSDEFTEANEKVNQQLQYLVGSWYVTSVKAYVMQLTGFEQVWAPDDYPTGEPDIRRLGILLDWRGRIAGFKVG